MCRELAFDQNKTRNLKCSTSGRQAAGAGQPPWASGLQGKPPGAHRTKTDGDSPALRGSACTRSFLLNQRNRTGAQQGGPFATPGDTSPAFAQANAMHLKFCVTCQPLESALLHSQGDGGGPGPRQTFRKGPSTVPSVWVSCRVRTQDTLGVCPSGPSH